MIDSFYIKSLRSVSSPLSSDSELDDKLWVSFLEGVAIPVARLLLSSVVLLELEAAVNNLDRGEETVVLLRGAGEAWLTVALSDFFIGVETTCRGGSGSRLVSSYRV